MLHSGGQSGHSSGWKRGDNPRGRVKKPAPAGLKRCSVCIFTAIWHWKSPL